MKILYALLVVVFFGIGIGIGGLLTLPQNELDITTNTITSRALSFNSLQLTDSGSSTELDVKKTDVSLEGPEERASPSDWIKESQIDMSKDGVTIHLSNPQWAIVANTNSMDPVLDDTSHMIQVVPMSQAEIHVGDILSYQAPSGYTIIHRVIEISEDENGWYAIAKGDNNPTADPWKVRFGMVKRITVAIIY